MQSQTGKRRADSSSSVSVSNQVLHIDGFTSADQDVVQYFGELQEGLQDEAVANSLVIGVSAFRLQNVVQPVDYIERRFSRIEESLDRQVDETRKAILESMVSQIGKDGLLSKFLDPYSIDTPLYKLKQEFRSSIMELATNIVAQRATSEVRKNTVQKGIDFENYVDQVFAEVLTKSDEYVDVSLVPGRLKANKKGDRLITPAGISAKIALEMKDVQRFSLSDIHSTGKLSNENRGAAYTIIVVKNARALPVTVGIVNEFQDHLVLGLTSEGTSEGAVEVHKELLALAYHLAKVRVLSNVRKDSSFDPKLLSERLDRIRDTIRELAKINAHASNIRSQLVSIEVINESVKSSIERELAAITCIQETNQSTSAVSDESALNQSSSLPK